MTTIFARPVFLLALCAVCFPGLALGETSGLKRTPTFTYTSPDIGCASCFLYIPGDRNVVYSRGASSCTADGKTAAGTVKSVRADTGQILWETPLPKKGNFEICKMMPSQLHRYVLVFRNARGASPVEFTVIDAAGRIVCTEGITGAPHPAWYPLVYHDRVAFSADDRFIAYYRDGVVRVHSLPENRPIASIRPESEIGALFFNGNSEIMVLSADGKVRRYDAATGTLSGKDSALWDAAVHFNDAVVMGRSKLLIRAYNSANSADRYLLLHIPDPRIEWAKETGSGESAIPIKYDKIVQLSDVLVFLDENDAYIGSFSGSENGPSDAFWPGEKAQDAFFTGHEAVIRVGDTFKGFEITGNKKGPAH